MLYDDVELGVLVLIRVFFLELKVVIVTFYVINHIHIVIIHIHIDIDIDNTIEYVQHL